MATNTNNHNNHRSKRKRDAPTLNPIQKASKALSWALRHQALNIGWSMTPDGYVPVAQILQSDHPRFRDMTTLSEIEQVVASNDKKRFHLGRKPASEYPRVRFSPQDIREDDQSVLCIRASQGHSIDFIDPLQLLTPLSPKELASIPVIVHGTYPAAWQQIQTEGLNRMTRNHIHFATGLPRDKQQVISGMRQSCTVHIYLNARKCAQCEDLQFFQSANGVLLTAGVKESGVLPVEFFSHVTDSKGNLLLDQRQKQEKSS
jgi:RNA:NAD 2'-phosphotransferase (TPT1/KptA family)